MVFKGRTVLVFLLVGMLASSVLTLAVAGPLLLDNRAKPAAAQQTASSSSNLTSQDINKLSTTYNLIHSRFLNEVDHDKVVNGAIHGMLAALDDPFTTYMDQKEAQQFSESISSSFQGIGAEVSLEDGRVVIVSPIKGSPAEKAGLQANDVVLSVNGEKLEGLSLSQAVMKIRGPKGSEAKLGILRNGNADPVEVIVVRDDIPVETVNAEMVAPAIGKIEIRQFSQNTAKRFHEEYEKLSAKGMKGLIIDVRNDPGGLLPEVVEIGKYFVEKGKPIVQIENRDGKRIPTLSDNANPYKIPTAVLINKGSASASEILAGAFKEAVGGKLVGSTTFGKGTVQVTFEQEMGDGSNIKMTTYKWLTPNGNWIHKNGIDPDIKADQPEYFKAAPFSKKAALKADMTGDDVKSLQIMLLGLGFDPERTDGYFSDKTAASLKEYQQKSGLPVTGEADTATMNNLEKDIVSRIKDPSNDNQLKEAVKVLQDQLNGK